VGQKLFILSVPLWFLSAKLQQIALGNGQLLTNAVDQTRKGICKGLIFSLNVDPHDFILFFPLCNVLNHGNGCTEAFEILYDVSDDNEISKNN
jgi:hypothetical protein